MKARRPKGGEVGRVLAIDAGFKAAALGTILDANITTLIAAVILFQLGSGPVRGFAVTLAVGILTTIFTAFPVDAAPWWRHGFVAAGRPRFRV